MWTQLANLDSIVLIIGLICFTILTIALLFTNQLTLTFGKNSFSLRKRTKRVCSDCLISFGKINSTYHLERHKILDPKIILGNEMKIAEHIIEKYRLKQLNKYQEMLLKHRKDESLDTVVNEDKEFLFFQETIENCIHRMVEAEFRRSFKENGIDKKTPEQFLDYVNGQTHTVVDLFKNYISNRYPRLGMTIPKDEVLSLFSVEDLTEDIFTIYKEAKSIALDVHTKIEGLDKRYDRDINSYISDVENG